MKTTIAAIVVALVAVVAANVALLTYGGARHDPVGRLSPVANLPSAPPAPAATVTHAEREDD